MACTSWDIYYLALCRKSGLTPIWKNLSKPHIAYALPCSRIFCGSHGPLAQTLQLTIQGSQVVGSNPILPLYLLLLLTVHSACEPHTIAKRAHHWVFIGVTPHAWEAVFTHHASPCPVHLAKSAPLGHHIPEAFPCHPAGSARCLEPTPPCFHVPFS